MVSADQLQPGPQDAAVDAGHSWDQRFRTLARGERPARIVGLLAGSSEPELVWRNQLGGQTWSLGDRFLKWSPVAAGIDLSEEASRLRWLEHGHPVPQLLDEGSDEDGRWLLTAAINAESAVSERWRTRPELAVRSIAEGLRRFHALPRDGVTEDWESWATRAPTALGPRPAIQELVVVHGDACSPNTLLDHDGAFRANVDLGDVAVADRWADLAVATMSLEWNYGPGWEACFLDAYGIGPDPARSSYYRALYHAES